MTDADEVRWDDADAAVQIEDDSPESLAGAEVEFDETADDWRVDEGVEGAGPEDFPSDPSSSTPAPVNLPVEGA